MKDFMKINHTSRLTIQGAFDKMVSAIKNQGRPSVESSSGLCFYRNSNGNKCAIGHLISDDQINKFGIKEKSSVMNFPLQLCEELITYPDAIDSRIFLLDMQTAHDTAATMHPLNNNLFMNEFLIECKEVAKKWNLKYIKRS